jgi:hypothetical protein
MTAKPPVTSGRFIGCRSARESRNGSRNSSPTTSPGMTIVASGSSGPGKYFSSSNRLRKYHSGRGM